jgi:hypothetical protein
MNIRLRAAAAALALGLAPLAASATTTVSNSGLAPDVTSPASLAANGPITIKYNTEFDSEQFDGRAGEYDGVLDVTFYPSGIIQGNYREIDSFPAPVPITGGFDAKSGTVWLDLRPLGGAHVEGHFTNTGILGYAPLGRVNVADHFDNQYRFQAVPAPNHPNVGR